MGPVSPPAESDEVSSLVHDMCAPLSVIALEADLLETRLPDPLPPEAKRALERIERNVAFLDRLVHDLLVASSGMLEYENIDLAALVHRVMTRLAASDAARIYTSLAPTIARVDVLRIERVIENLLHNALKYAPPRSGIVIRLEEVDEVAMISIIDTGPGLAAGETTEVFEKHRRGEAAQAHVGFGIGLYASRKIVEAHGGRIGVDSMPGHGTRFYFELPSSSKPRTAALMSGDEHGARKNV